MNQKSDRSDLKNFFIKLIAIVFSIIIIINMSYNLIFADKMENINKIFNISKKENIDKIKDKIRLEITSSLDKDKIINEEDKILLYKFYLKLKNEFSEVKE